MRAICLQQHPDASPWPSTPTVQNAVRQLPASRLSEIVGPGRLCGEVTRKNLHFGAQENGKTKGILGCCTEILVKRQFKNKHSKMEKHSFFSLFFPPMCDSRWMFRRVCPNSHCRGIRKLLHLMVYRKRLGIPNYKAIFNSETSRLWISIVSIASKSWFLLLMMMSFKVSLTPVELPDLNLINLIFFFATAKSQEKRCWRSPALVLLQDGALLS